MHSRLLIAALLGSLALAASASSWGFNSGFNQQATQRISACVFRQPTCRKLIWRICPGTCTPAGAQSISNALANAIGGFALSNSKSEAKALFGDALALR